MINMTDSEFSFIAENGDIARIPPSGYTAQVERGRANVKWVKAGEILIHCCKEKAKIIFQFENFPLRFPEDEFRDKGLLLVTREVAEAAKIQSHPLASLMAWPDEAEYGEGSPGRLNGAIIAYRELRLVDA
jgi:hypothetical protein